LKTLGSILTAIDRYTCILLASKMWLASFSEPLVLSTDWLYVTAKNISSNHVIMLLSCSFLRGAVSLLMGLWTQGQMFEYFRQFVTGNSATGTSSLVIGTVQRNDVLKVRNMQLHVSCHEHEHRILRVYMWWAASREQ
jgi:hypothetical protein